MLTKIRYRIARAVWKTHDFFYNTEPLNRLGCYIAWGKDWRTRND